MREAFAFLCGHTPRIIPQRSGHNTRMTAANRGDAPRFPGRKTDERRTRNYAPSSSAPLPASVRAALMVSLAAEASLAVDGAEVSLSAIERTVYVVHAEGRQDL